MDLSSVVLIKVILFFIGSQSSTQTVVRPQANENAPLLQLAPDDNKREAFKSTVRSSVSCYKFLLSGLKLALFHLHHQDDTLLFFFFFTFFFLKLSQICL